MHAILYYIKLIYSFNYFDFCLPLLYDKACGIVESLLMERRMTHKETDI